MEFDYVLRSKLALSSVSRIIAAYSALPNYLEAGSLSLQRFNANV